MNTSLASREGSLFDSNAPALGHGVNVDMVMGAGVAALMRSRFPGLFTAYREACSTGALQPGGMFPWQDPATGRFVYNLASQDRPGRYARLGWVVSSAHLALAHADLYGLMSVAIPQIGCGIGGLRWEQVEPALAEVESSHSATFEVWTLPPRR